MGRPPLLTGSGLVCLAVALPGYESGARWLRFARKHLSGMFPVPAATVRLQQRLRTASPLVKINRYVQQRASLAKPPHHRSSARILRSAMSGSTVLDARCIYLGSTPAAVITDRTRRFRELRVSAGPMFAPCLLGCRGTARQRAAPRGSRSPGLPYSPARHSIARHHAPLLLIRCRTAAHHAVGVPPGWRVHAGVHDLGRVGSRHIRLLAMRGENSMTS